MVVYKKTCHGWLFKCFGDVNNSLYQLFCINSKPHYSALVVVKVNLAREESGSKFPPVLTYNL